MSFFSGGFATQVSALLGASGVEPYRAPLPGADVALSYGVARSPTSREIDVVYDVAVGGCAHVSRRYEHFVSLHGSLAPHEKKGVELPEGAPRRAADELFAGGG